MKSCLWLGGRVRQKARHREIIMHKMVTVRLVAFGGSGSLV